MNQAIKMCGRQTSTAGREPDGEGDGTSLIDHKPKSSIYSCIYDYYCIINGMIHITGEDILLNMVNTYDKWVEYTLVVRCLQHNINQIISLHF